MANEVQSNLASGILNQFHVNIGMNLQSKLQDWQGRQQIQYGAVKGLMKSDWHGLDDFKTQMSSYSATFRQGRTAWAVIKALVPNNAKIIATLVKIPGFGQVGQQVLSLVGISNVLVAPQDILKSQSKFNATIASVS